MNINDFVTGNQLIADISTFCDDEDMKERSIGWYTSQIQQALEELSFETFFDKGRARILKLDQEKLQIPLPKGVFNIQEMYLFNCSCQPETVTAEDCVEDCACCLTRATAKVYWKRQFNNQPKGGTSYTASRKEAGTVNPDPIMPYGSVTGPEYDFTVSRANLHWANIQNGIIMFGSSCRGYNRVKIIYTGMLCDIGEAPLAPRFFRQAVVDFVCERFYRRMKSKEPRKFRPIWSDYKSEVTDENINGSWHKAKRRAMTMDTWERETMREFIGRPNY